VILNPTCGFQILFVARQIYEGDHFRRFLAHLNAQKAIEQEIFSSYSSQGKAVPVRIQITSDFA
jgi:hypothetical protein